MKHQVNTKSILTNLILFSFPLLDDYLRESREPIIFVKVDALQNLYQKRCGGIVEVEGEEGVLDSLVHYQNYKGQRSITMNGHTANKDLVSTAVGFFKNKTLMQVLKEFEEWESNPF